MTAPLLELDAVEKRYGDIVALKALDFRIEDGDTPIIAIAGESGSGKTTLASLLLGFAAPSSGEVRYCGTPLPRLKGAARRNCRREVQAVFQDPFAVYNPFYRVDHALSEPLKLFGLAASRREAQEKMRAACELVGIQPCGHAGAVSAPIVRRPAPAPDGGARAAPEAALARCR